MENHILLSSQLEHLKKHKAISSNSREIEKFICDKPYEMTIQQVKIFFKGPNNDYISKPIGEWTIKYNQLDTDSHKMFRKIIEIENKLKNELFVATYNNQKWIDEYDKFVNIDADKPYYKKINSTSMGNIIEAYKKLYELTGNNILHYTKQCEILNFKHFEQEEFARIRSANSSSYVEDAFFQKLKSKSITILEIERIEYQIKNEIKNWIKTAVEYYKERRLEDLIPEIFATIISRSYCTKNLRNVHKSEEIIAKQNDMLMMELIDCYLSNGLDYKQIKRKVLNTITNNIYNTINGKLVLELGNIYSEPNNNKSKLWVEYFEENNLDLKDAITWMKKTHITVEIERGSKFSSTKKLLIAYKTFRDQVAHGRTIVEPLKTPNDIIFKRMVLSNLVTEDFTISLDEYLRLCDYWEK